MRPLLALSVRWSVAMALGVLSLGIAAGTIRLLPWLVAPGVPLRLCAPFAELLVGAALEAALLVGLPVGIGIGAALFVERGEARAFAALGLSPLVLIRSIAALGVVMVAAYTLGASLVDPESPGVLARRLVETGKSSCRDVNGGRVDVPLVGVSWLCFATPRVSGRIPGVRSEAWFSATALRPDEDLGKVDLEDVHVAGKLGNAGPPVSLQASHVRIRGLSRWGHPRSFSGHLRGFLVVSSALAAALLAAWFVVRDALGAPIIAAAVAGASAASMLAVLHALDAQAASVPAYGCVPAIGAGAIFVGFFAAKRLHWRRVAGARPW